MQLFQHAIFAIICIIQQQYVHAQHNTDSDTDIDLSKSIEHATEYTAIVHGMLNHTFVTLIDIVFTDGAKRTCTGTIIHDKVVITARHCLGMTHDKSIYPEITASFVVIGSKKMFESGYEQYLPIERIISHPKYRGWTADIALVYTFAGMMSDKPGTILPLAGQKISMPKNSNLTVLSWGHYKESDIQSEKENDFMNWKGYTKYQLRAINTFSVSEEILPSNTTISSNTPRLYIKASRKSKLKKIKRNRSQKLEQQYNEYSTKRYRVTEGLYRAKLSLEEYGDEDSVTGDYDPDINHKLVQDPQKHYGSIFKNWRRSVGSDKNELSVETFKLVDAQICEEKLRKSVPDKYKIKNFNEYICYSPEDRFVTDEDAGAPAVRLSHLIAVTVGGVDCDDEHIAVGIKISCFCNWIAENLPDGGESLNCCDHCCDDAKSIPPNADDIDRTQLRIRKKKKTRS